MCHIKALFRKLKMVSEPNDAEGEVSWEAIDVNF